PGEQGEGEQYPLPVEQGAGSDTPLLVEQREARGALGRPAGVARRPPRFPCAFPLLNEMSFSLSIPPRPRRAARSSPPAYSSARPAPGHLLLYPLAHKGHPVYTEMARVLELPALRESLRVGRF